MKKIIFMVLFPILLFGQLSNEIVYSSAKSYKGASDTVGSSTADGASSVSHVDTLSRKIVSSTSNSVYALYPFWYQVSVASIDDTLEICTASTFTNSVMLLPGDIYTTNKLITIDATNMYIRRYYKSGATGSPRYNLSVWGR